MKNKSFVQNTVGIGLKMEVSEIDERYLNIARLTYKSKK